MNAKERQQPLRIAIVSAGASGFENWELMVFDRLLADPRFEIAAFLIHPSPNGIRKPPAAFALAQRIERALLVREKRYLPKEFNAARQRIEKLSGNGAVDAALLRSVGADVALRLVPEGLEQEALSALPLGEWAFDFTDRGPPGGNTFAYRELMEDAPGIALTLSARLSDRREPRVISQASFNTRPSAALAAAAIRERAVTLLMRELSRAADEGLPPFVPMRSTRLKPPLSGSEVARYAARLGGRLLRRAAKAARARLGTESAVWTLYTGSGGIDSFDPARAVEIPPAAGDIRADPFLFMHDGECYLFYEGYAAGDRKAHISVARLKDEKIEPLGVALDCPHHLSYPFVFRHGEHIYMMPESHRSGRIEIWRCVEFPLKWELHATALEGRAPVDSVLVPHAGKWWLFTNMSDRFVHEDHCAELYVFQVDGPDLKEIVPHRRNPVVIGSATARNGGRIVDRNGKLLRPAQNNAHGIYGYGLKIMEISELSLDAYRERCIRSIEPDFKPGLFGCHHFDEAGGRYILDARLTV